MKKVRNRILLIVLIAVLAVAVAAGITWGVKKGSDTAVAASKTFTVGSDEYDDFSSAMDAARTSSFAAQKTVTMNADYTLTSVYTLDAGYFVTLDLNGHTLDASSLKQAIVVYGTFTLDDSTGVFSTLTSGTVGVSRTSSGTKPYRTVYTSSSFSGKEEYNMYDGDTTQSYRYYESGAIICSSNGGTNYSYYESGTVTVLQNGTFNMYGGTLTGGSAYYGAAVTVSGSDSTGSGYNPVFNMYGGSISGNSVTMVGGALFMANGGEAYISGGIIAHNTASNSSSGGAAIAVTGGGCSLTLGEYKSGLDIRAPLVISHNEAGYGAAIVMDDGVFLYIYDGTEISNNYATGSSTGGGAMYLHDTQGYMYGGSIIDNTCKTKGGAVYLTSSTFTMSGGDLTFNGVSTCAYSYGSQPDYGGNFYLLNSTFEMTGGSLVSGVASVYGGGLYIDGGTASITGGEILGSASYTGGAGVYIAGGGAFTLGGTGDIILNSTTGTCGAGVFVASGTTFTMTGGRIEKNLILMGSYGGAGVYVDGTFEMTGGDIENNMCQLSGNGGGVYLSSSGVMYLYGGSISGNSAATSAGGVYDAGSLHVMGKVTAFGNTSGSSSSNIYLINGKYITLDGVVSSGSEIGISFANSSQTQVTTEESSTSFYMQSYFYFSMDSASSGYMMGYSGAYVEKIATSSLSYYVNVNGSAQYCIGLSDALYLSSETNSPVMLNAEKVDVSSSVTVEAGWNSSIDLGGKTLAFASGVRLVVYGTLTVRDSAEISGETSEAGGSTVSNGDGTYTTTYSTNSSSASGRGVTTWHTYTSGALTTAESSLSTGFIDVFAGGTFNLEGGHITGGAALYASVFNVSGTSSSHAKLNITGGAVAGNKSGYYGAIFATHADVFITGGVIAGNTGYTYSKKDYNYSGAVTISTDAYLTVGGGAVISGNTGAAIIYSLDGTVTVEGYAELSGNTLSESLMGYGGVVAMSGDSTLYLYGGRIIENVVANFGAVGLSGSSGDVRVYAAGDAVVCFNYMDDAQTERNLYFNAGTETFVIEAGFYGYIGVTISLSLKDGDVGYAQVALNSAGLSIDEVRAVIFSDEGCECIHPEGDGYVYFYEKHVAGGLVMDTLTVIDGKVDAYHTCLFCGDRGDDYEGSFTYGYDDDGRAVIYAE
ncbi:MAG: hypothetical protein LUD29_06535, partial [Clostridia bacterium]|nr:hypothetical protein [Clostridia bacterium]